MVAIPRALLLAIRRRAEAAYPDECCGLLLGTEHGKTLVRVSAAVASANVAAERRRHFEVDPALYLRLLHARPASAAAARLIGLYHSHPEGAAAPSRHDEACAWQEGWLWLIVPLGAGRAGAPRCFRLLRTGGPFAAVPLARA